MTELTKGRDINFNHYRHLMTLGIMIGTSSGIVICTDSLVTTSKTHNILKDIKNVIDLPKEIWDIVNDGEYGFATPNSNLSETDSIISTSPNVKKMFQIGEHAIVFTLAGENHWKFTKFNENGISTDFPIPMEAYVDTVVQLVINELPESSSFEEIVRCLTFVLNYGQLHDNQQFSENHKSMVYSIMGGGYGKSDSYPRAFRYKMPGGIPRQSALNACNHIFSTALSASFIQSSDSTNWFDQYCQENLVAAIDAAHSQAWVWGAIYGWSPQTIIENLIPDVNYNIVNCLTVLSEITSNDPHSFLNAEDLCTPKIISKVWNSYISSTSKGEIENIVSKINNVTPRILDLLQLEDSVEHIIEFRDRVLEYVSQLFPGPYSEQSDKVKKSITEVAFNAIWDLINKMMPSVMLSLSQISGKTSSDSIEFARTMWTGLDFVGNGEMIEKITSGIDAETYWNLSDNIKSYQMHAAERLATIIGGKLQSKEVPEYVPFGKKVEEIEDQDEAKIKSANSETPLAHNQLTLPIQEERKQDNEASSKVDISGQWKGFYTKSNEENDTNEKYQFEIEFSRSDEKTFIGECSQHSLSTISVNNGKIIERDRIQFEMIIDGNQLSHLLVECEIKAWGVEGSFELEGKRESLIMHRNDKNSIIDSEKLTSDALNQLIRELERIHPKIKPWDVNYTTLPLESAVEMAHYLMNSTVMKQRFNQELPSVGGPIRTMVITRNDGVMASPDYVV